MSSASSVSEVDITNLKKSSPSPQDLKAKLNPDAAVFETGPVSKDLLKTPENQLKQEEKEEMPSPQVLPSAEPGVMVNGSESSVFVEPHAGARQNIPEHIKPDELPKDELRTLVRQQLEYYFSRENLAGDTYLVSQMDSDQYVLIQIVANFNQMKKLTNNIEIVKEAIKESAYLQMDDSQTKMRPNMKRCIVILREVPEDTSVQEVEELFSGEGCPKYVSCEPANNNYWYIQFENEDCAQKAYRYLREDIKTFKGKPIMARIKAKPMPRAASSFAKNGLRPTNEPSTISSSPFRYPISPLFGGHQGYSFFQPPVPMSQWPASQHFFDPTLIPTIPNNAYHTPQNFNKSNNHQGIRPFYQNNRNRNQTRSYRESSERVDKDSLPYRPRAHSTNGTTNTTSSSSVGTNTGPNNKSPSNTTSSSFMSWRRNEDEYRPGPRTRKRRGSSEDIRTSRSPIPQEPQRSKDDSHFNLSNAQFPPLPSANTFKTSDLPLQSQSTKQEYNKVASSPPLSPPVTPTSTPRVTTSKPEREDAKEKIPNESNETPAKKEDIIKTETKKVIESELNSKDSSTKENAKTTTSLAKTKETLLSEKLSYAQIAQKKALQNKQQSNATTATTVTTVNSAQS